MTIVRLLVFDAPSPPQSISDRHGRQPSDTLSPKCNKATNPVRASAPGAGGSACRALGTVGLAAALTLAALAAAIVLVFGSGQPLHLRGCGPSGHAEVNGYRRRRHCDRRTGGRDRRSPSPVPPASPASTLAPPAGATLAALVTPQPASTESPPPPPTEAPTVEVVAPRTDPSAGLRDKYRQPFSSSSIWNMPIGSGAIYVPAEIGSTGGITVDEEYWLVTDTSMPLRPFYTNATFGPGRCETATTNST